MDVVFLCQSIFFLNFCSGKTVLIENIEETLEPTLDNLLGRNLIKKGKLVKFFSLSLSLCLYLTAFSLSIIQSIYNSMQFFFYV